MAADTPEWLLVMRAMNGLTETAGSADNPKILAMRDEIAKTYSDMSSYCALYQHDATPWCGLAVAYCMTMAGIRPVWGSDDTDRWMWARAWDDEAWGYELATPRPGCVVVMEREGGGHVTLYERTEGSMYVCRGGNQSDAINAQSYAISKVVALMWPREDGVPPEAPRREIEQSASGPDVEYLQATLGIPPDGEFGAVTEAGVKGFQVATGLDDDGVVGPMTWEKIDELARRMETGSDGISNERQEQIAEMVVEHPIQRHVWEDRGRAPVGYVAGIAQVFALALTWLAAGDPIALEMAQAESGDSKTDALSRYRAQFTELGMSNAKAGVDTMRHLFALIIGLGMRESSGKYYEGRDVSASNVSSETCEAGLLQMSWDLKSASPSMGKLLEYFWSDPNGFLPTFAVGLTPTSSGLMNYGSGQGTAYQFLAKYCPSFCILAGAVGLRKRCKHWGPLVRYEVELISEADDVLLQVQKMMESAPPEPEPDEEPEPLPPGEVATVDIIATGPVLISINGAPVILPGVEP